MVKEQVKLFVEGGGKNNKQLASDARRGFSHFLSDARLQGNRPKVIPCGTRNDAYENYRIAVENSELAVLLVDSEAPVESEFETGDIHNWKPWEQLRSRKDDLGRQCDNWEVIGSDTDCHLMVQMMETWFLADVKAVKEYYKHNFKKEEFPKKDVDIEQISKDKVYSILKKSISEAKASTYDKGRDSFRILERLNAEKVKARSKWANRFFTLLAEKMR